MPRSPRSQRSSCAARREFLRKVRLSFEVLEDRTLLDAASPLYLPPQFHLFNAASYLTEPSAATPVVIAENYLRSRAADLGLLPGDLDNYIIQTNYVSDSTGVTHLTFQQSLHGLEVANANFNVNVAADGRVLNVGGGFVPGLSSRAGEGLPTPGMTAEQAVAAAAANLGLQLTQSPAWINEEPDERGAVTLRAPSVSLDDIAARLHYVALPGDGVSLAWNLTLRTPDNNHWYSVSVDSFTGQVTALVDYASHASYEVFEIPKESPYDGPRTVQSDPHLITPAPAVTPSPFGWHDTDGVAGAEFTITRGNNVNAYADRDANDIADAGSQPDGGPGLDFTGPVAPLDLTQNPVTYTHASVVNLFYWNNILHDIHYLYGFNEAARNFQTNTYGRGGVGNDAVNAETQDGSGTNNANFFTPPDGSPGRMQMYEFTNTNPRRDSSFDAEIVIHEYGHGVSNRLTGNAFGLEAVQSGGMGEGWSDWWALMLTQKSASETTDGRGMGTYALGQPSTGQGIRQFRYDFDISNQNLETFINYNSNPAVHSAGTRWAATLWDLNHLLIERYGFEPNVYNSTSGAGNIRALHLVMNGLKLQPSNPSFLQARDAILLADTVLYGSAHHLEIWTAFARRGLGQFASTTSSSSFTLTTDFTIPPEVLNLRVTGSLPAAGSAVPTPPTEFVLDFNGAVTPASVQATDLVVNGIASDLAPTLSNGDQTITFRFTTSPVTAEGLQTMALAADAVLRASNGRGNEAFSATFHFDTLPMQVLATSPANNTQLTLPLGTLVLDVDLNEAVDSDSVGTNDLTFTGGPVTVLSATAQPGNLRVTYALDLSGLTTENTITFSFAANSLTDGFGNLMQPYTGTFPIDFGVAVPLTGLTPRNPLGSLIYDVSRQGTIGVADDVDSFVIDLDAGQTLTVVVDPAATLRPIIEVRDPSGTLVGGTTAAAAGSDAVVQTVLAGVPGTYTVAVLSADGTTGSYRIDGVLNAAVEDERHDGPSNGPNAAQDIDPAFTDLGDPGERGGVLGTVSGPTDRDQYSLTLNAGDTVTIGLESLTGGNVDLRLLSFIGVTVRIWDGGGADNNWTTAANWVGDEAPTAGDTLVFAPGAARLTPFNNFAATTAFHSIVFSGSGYSVSGNSVTLTAGVVSTIATGSSSFSPTIILAADQTFLNTFAGTGLSVGTINTNGRVLTADGSGTVTLFGVISGAGSLVKNGPGTLSLQAANIYTGLTTINAGTVNIINPAALGSTTAGTVVNDGATLQIATGTALTVAEPLTLHGQGIGTPGLLGAGALRANIGATQNWTGAITLGSDASIGVAPNVTFNINTSPVTLNGYTLTATVGTVGLTPPSGVLNFNTPIVDGPGGSGSLSINGLLTTGTVNLTAASSFTGTSTVHAGLLALTGANGSLDSANVVINPASTLRLDNSAANNSNRLPDAASLTLNGGLFELRGANGATTAEAIGTLLLNRGFSGVSTTPGAGGSVQLLAAELARGPDATAGFFGPNLGSPTNRITFTAAPTEVGEGQGTFASEGILPYVVVGSSATTLNDFANYDSTGNTIRALPSGAYIPSLALAPASGTGIVRLPGGETVTADRTVTGLLLAGGGSLSLNAALTAGALAAASTSFSPIIQGTGILNLAGTAVTPGEGLLIANAAPTTTFNLVSNLAASNRIIKSGAGQLLLAGTKSHTGGTVLTAGQLQVNNNGSLGTGTFDLYAGALLSGLANVTLANPVALSDANAVIMGGQAIIFSGPVTLTGANTLNITNTAAAGTAFTGPMTGSGSLQKIGTSLLTLAPTAPSDYTGGTILQGGTLSLNTNNAPLGTGELRFVGGTLRSGVAGGSTLDNALRLNGGSVTFNSNTLGFTGEFTFSGEVNLTGVSTTNVLTTTTFAGTVTGTGGLIKTTTAGTLVLAGTNSATGALAANTGALAPVGIQTAPAANFANGGALRLRVHGFDTPGTDYDRLDLGSGPLGLSATAQLTLDLAGLTSPGTAAGVVRYGSRTGAIPIFGSVALINNPNNYSAVLTYHADSIDVTLVASTSPPATVSGVKFWDGGSLVSDSWSDAANWAGDIAPVEGEDLVFAAGAARLSSTNDFAAGTRFGSITFAAPGFTLDGNPFALTGGIRTTHTTGTSTVNAGVILAADQTFTSTFANSLLLFGTAPGAGALDTGGFTLTVDGTGNMTFGDTGTVFLDRGVIGGEGGLVKNGPGTLRLAAANTYTGLTTINAGTLEIAVANNPSPLGPLGSLGTVVNSGATLQMANSMVVTEELTLFGSGLNTNPTVAAGALRVAGVAGPRWTGAISLGSDAAIGVNAGGALVIEVANGGALDLAGYTLTLNSASFVGSSAAPALVGVAGLGVLSPITGTGNLVINETLTTGQVTLGAASTFAGTVVVQSGLLTVTSFTRAGVPQTGGSLTATDLVVNQGATLRVDNTLANSLDRLADDATITLNGGTLDFRGNTAAGAVSTETVGAIALNRGHSTISSQAGALASTLAQLIAGSLLRNPGATANFAGVNAPLGAGTPIRNRITFITAPGEGILPFATATDSTVNSGNHASYDASPAVNSILATPDGAYLSSINGAPDGAFVRLTGNQTVTAPPVNGLGGLVLDGVATVTIDGVPLTVASLVTTAAATGTINALGAGKLDLAGEGLVIANGALTINAPLDAANRLVKSGTNSLTMGGTQDYEGGTTLNSGSLTAATGTLGVGVLELVNGTLQSSAAATLDNPVTLADAVVTIGGGGFTFNGPVTLSGRNALTFNAATTVNGSITDGSGPGSLWKLGPAQLNLAPAAPSSYSGGTVSALGTLSLNTANSPLGTGPLTLVAGTLQTSVAGGFTLDMPITFSASTVFVGTTVAPFNQPITFSGAATLVGLNTLTTNFQGTTLFSATSSLGGTGALTKGGGNTLELAGTNTHTGATAVNGGTMLINGLLSGSPTAVLTGTLGGVGALSSLTARGLAGQTAGAVNPGNPATARGIQSADSANFSDGGNLTLQVAGFDTPGVDYDQLLVSGDLILGGGSTLTLDLTGVSGPGTASGVVRFGRLLGAVPTFTSIVTTNNPTGLSPVLTYNADSIDVTFVPGAVITQPAPRRQLQAVGVTDFTNVDELILSYTAEQSGTYYIQVSGTAAADYSLVVTRNATFDAESNDDFLTVAPQVVLSRQVNGQQQVLGHVARPGRDVYQVFMEAGGRLEVQTATPADGAGQFVNLLDAVLRLYGPSGQLVLEDDNSADGRNAFLGYDVPFDQPGLYFIEVAVADASVANGGEYVLSITGAASPPEVTTFDVTGTLPGPNVLLVTPPTTLTVNFNRNVLPESLQASDLTVDGVAATGLSIVDGNTVTFTLPTIAQSAGIHLVEIAAGAIESLQGIPVTPYLAAYFLDLNAPRVIDSSLDEGGGLPAGDITYQVRFDETINYGTLDATDLELRGLGLNLTYTPDSFFYDVDTSTLTVSFSGLPEDNYRLTLFSGNGRFEDLAGRDLDGEPPAGPWQIPPQQSGNGIDGGNFVVNFGLFEDNTVALPLPFTARLPLGSLIYDRNVTSNTQAVADVDRFTVALDAGQTISVLAVPAAGLQIEIALFDSDGILVGSTSTTAPGQEIALPAAAVTVAGTYTIRVSGLAGSGSYSLGVTLNADREAETPGASTNNSREQAQDLTPAFIDLGGGATRAAVGGRADLTADLLPTEIESNNTTATANEASANFAAFSGERYHLGLKGSSATSSDQDFFRIGTLQAGDVLTITQSGSGSLRGTNTDTLVELYRGPAGAPIFVTSADQGGPGNDSLIFRFTVTTADTYYINARAFTSGTYDLAVFLENAGEAPATDGTVTGEAEPNGTAATATDASASWRPVQYLSRVAGTITSADVDVYRFLFNAGDLVTVHIDSTSTLDARVELLNAGGTVIAQETGISSGPGTDSWIQGFLIPTTGVYFVRVQPFSGTGTYNADVYLSAATLPPGPAIGSDYYSFALAAGETVSLALRAEVTSNVDLALEDEAGNLIALGAGGFTNVDEAIRTFTAPAAGIWFARVTGTVLAPYTLVVTRGADFSVEGNDSLATARNITGQPAVLGSISPATESDYYRFSVTAGDVLTFSTTTPADGPDQFSNTLNPFLELYNPAGTLVASDDNGAGDGRNALLSYTALVTGDYTVRVRSVSPTTGEYVLRLNGNTVTLPAFQVSSTTPANGVNVTTAITTYTVNFNDLVQLTSLEASDLTVDGLEATGFSVVDGDTVNFLLPALPDGPHAVAIADGAILDLQGTPLLAFAGSYTQDATPPRVVLTSVQENDVLTAGSLTITVGFSERMRRANLDATDFTLRGVNRGVLYPAATFGYGTTDTVLTLTFNNLPEDRYTLTLLSADGRFEDVAGLNLDGEPVTFPIPPNQSGDGVQGGNFVVNFDLDVDIVPYPVLLVARAPLGSLVYGLGAPVGSTAAVTHIYDLDGTLADALGGPALVSAGGTLEATGYAFNAGQGPNLSNAINPTTYSIEMLFRIDATSGYRRLIEFKNLTVDTGLYNLDGALNFYNVTTGPGTVFTAGQLHHVVLTRDGQTNQVVGYVDGVQQISFIDSTSLATFAATNNIIHFLRDDGSENASGFLDRIRIYNGVLTAEQAAALADGAAPPTGLTGSTGSIVPSADIDSYTLHVDAGQTITILVDPDAALQPTVTLFDPSDAPVGTADATAAGREAVVQTIPIAMAGTYRIAVSGLAGTTGQYAVQVTLNAALEDEAHDGPGNDSPAAAQDIGPSFLELPKGASRGAVLGNATSGSDFYRFSVGTDDSGAVQPVTLVVGGLAGLTLEVQDESGTVLATGVAGATNVSQAIHKFTAPAAGTYYARISGTGDYNLVLTRGADFDTEPNDTPATALDLSGTTGVPGYVRGGGGLGRLFTLDATARQIREIDPQTGAILRSFASPLPASFQPDYGMATTPTSLLVGSDSPSAIYELNPDTGATIRTIPNPGAGSISGLAFLDNEIFVLTDDVTGRITVLDYGSGAVLRTLSASPVNEGLGASALGLYWTAGLTLYQINPQTGAVTNLGTLPSIGSSEGVGVIGGELYIADQSVIRVYDLNTRVLRRTLSGLTDLEAIGADGGGTSDADWYQLTAPGGQDLVLFTITPAAGNGQFVNLLDPHIELFDPDDLNTPVAVGVPEPDGHNERIVFAVPDGSPRTYLVRVTAENDTAGEYYLDPPLFLPRNTATDSGTAGALWETAPLTLPELVVETGLATSDLNMQAALSQLDPTLLAALLGDDEDLVLEVEPADDPFVADLFLPAAGEEQEVGGAVKEPAGMLAPDGEAEDEAALNEQALDAVFALAGEGLAE